MGPLVKLQAIGVGSFVVLFGITLRWRKQIFSNIRKAWLHCYYKKEWVMPLYYRMFPPQKQTWCALLEFKGVTMPAQNIWPQTLRSLPSFTAREDDVFIVTYPKCGTHMIAPLVLEILFINHPEHDEVMRHATDTTPGMYPLFLEFGHPMYKAFDKLRRSPRVFQTHLPVKLFPQDALQRNARIVYMTRSPRACTVSALQFCKAKKRKLFEPSVEELVDSEWDPSVQIFTGWHQHAADWSKVASQSHTILQLTFEEALEDPVGSVKRLAAFLGKDLSDADITKAVDLNSLCNRRKEAGAADQKYFRKGASDDSEWDKVIPAAVRSKFERLFAERWQHFAMDNFSWLSRYAPAAPSAKRDLRTLPKAHLHIHLEGAMRRSTLVELCKRYGLDVPPDSRGEKFDAFRGFKRLFKAARDSIQSREDLSRIILEIAEDAASDGCLWVELSFNPDWYTYRSKAFGTQLFETHEEIWTFLFEAAAVAEEHTQVGIGFIPAINRTRPLEEARRLACSTNAIVRSGKHTIRTSISSVQCSEHCGIIGFGLQAEERGFPPAQFGQMFRTATEGTTLISVPHAGEIAPDDRGGAASVLDALDKLGAKRIFHGVLAVEDTSVVKRLADERICLDVCPTSNIMLKVFPSPETHPLPVFLRSGVPCSINCDDPLLLGVSLVDEYELCRRTMGLSDAQLADIAQWSFEFSGAPEGLKAEGKRTVIEWLQTVPESIVCS